MIVDIVVDLSYGDCGKGKVTHDLLKKGKYTHCIRYNGGHNAGHTIIHEGQKVITHIIPAGVFFGVKSIIGPGCVVSPKLFLEEIQELEAAGLNVRGNIFIDKRAHVVTENCLTEDARDASIGTTKRGNGPAYRNKYNRSGFRAEYDPDLKDFIIDIYEELYEANQVPIVLMEGAQGFGLDIDWGDYPYVTSSHCTVAGAMLNGIPPKAVRDIYGVIKGYETYVGAKEFHGKGEIFDLLRQVGKEYGATTGRPRQCNYLNMSILKRAIRINGVTKLIVNKMDVLNKLNHWGVRNKKGNTIIFAQEEDFKRHLIDNTDETIVYFSYSPDKI